MESCPECGTDDTTESGLCRECGLYRLTDTGEWEAEPYDDDEPNDFLLAQQELSDFAQDDNYEYWCDAY